MSLHRVLLALFLTRALQVVDAQTVAPVTLAGSDVRVEVRSVNGRLEERYQARAANRWITIASSVGETGGPISVHGSGGEILAASLRSVSIERGTLVERLSAGPHEMTR